MNPLIKAIFALTVLLAFTVVVTEAYPQRRQLTLKSRFDTLIENYHVVSNSGSCVQLRTYALAAYKTAILYEGQIAAGGGSGECYRSDKGIAMFDLINRVVCLIRNEFTQEEKIGLLFIGTVYSILLYITGIMLTIVLSAIWEFIAETCGTPPPPRQQKNRSNGQTQTRRGEVKTAQPITKVHLYPNLNNNDAPTPARATVPPPPRYYETV